MRVCGGLGLEQINLAGGSSPCSSRRTIGRPGKPPGLEGYMLAQLFEGRARREVTLRSGFRKSGEGPSRLAGCGGDGGVASHGNDPN